MWRSELTSEGKVLLRGGGRHPYGLSRYRCGGVGRWCVPLSFAREHHNLFCVPLPLLRLAERDARCAGSRPSGIPDSFWQRLYPYQRDAVCRVVNQYLGRCLLAHDMGLGKTVQSMAVMHHYGGPVLVVCPAFLRETWRCALSEWCEGLDVTVLSYDCVRRGGAPGAQWRLIVCDECHYLKQRDSGRSRALLPLLHSCDRVLLMSGTPCPNRPEELFYPLHALRPSLVPDFRWFGLRYCNARATRFSRFDTSGSSRSGELSWLLRRAFMLRLRKQDVLGDLPPKLCSVRRVSSSSPGALIRLAELSEQLEDASASRLKSVVSEMFRATCEAKLSSVSAYVVHRARQSPVLAFAHHRAMLDALCAGGESAGLRVCRMDGDTPMAARQSMVDSIQSGECAVDLACFSMAVAGVGFTLTSLSRVVFCELPWNPALLRQCEDRVYRIGQTRACHIEYLLCDGTLDDHVWRRIHEKEKVTKRSI